MTSKEYRKQKNINNRMKRKLALIFVVIVLALVGLSVRIVVGYYISSEEA